MRIIFSNLESRASGYDKDFVAFLASLKEVEIVSDDGLVLLLIKAYEAGISHENELWQSQGA